MKRDDDGSLPVAELGAVTMELSADPPPPPSPSGRDDFADPTHRMFGRYQLLYRLASGGMAKLYLGRLAGPNGFSKLVAVKLIHDHLTENPEFVEMFIDEARIASQINHPHVAQVLELGEFNGQHFMAMEYIEGETLNALLRRTPLSHEQAVRVVASAAAALHAAHELRTDDGELCHVVHRDVSPHNILVGYDGNAKLIDFGVATARSSLHTTSAGVIKGKFAYMSPEQARGLSVDRRADIFALGIVLFEATTGQRLFKGATEVDTLTAVARCEVKLPSQLASDYPAELERIVLRALSADPQARYQTAYEMQADLEAFLLQRGDPVLPAQMARLMRSVFADRLMRRRQLLSRLLESGPSEETSAAELALHEESATSTAGALRRLTMMTLAFLRRRRWVLPAAVATVALVAVGLFFLRDHRSVEATAAERPRRPQAAVVAQRAVVAKHAPSVPAATGERTGQHRERDTEPADEASSRPEQASSRPEAAGRSGQPKPISITIQATPRRAEIRFAGKRVSNPFVLKRRAADGRTARAVVRADGYETKRIEVPLDRSTTWMLALERAERSRAHRSSRRRRRRRRRERARRADRKRRRRSGKHPLETTIDPFSE